mgnify:CR=1 FL=1
MQFWIIAAEVSAFLLQTIGRSPNRQQKTSPTSIGFVRCRLPKTLKASGARLQVFGILAVVILYSESKNAKRSQIRACVFNIDDDLAEIFWFRLLRDYSCFSLLRRDRGIDSQKSA